MAVQQPLTQFTFYLSCDLNLPVQVKIDQLRGCIPDYAQQLRHQLPGSLQPVSLYCTATLCAYGEVLGLPISTQYATADLHGANFSTVLTFPIKYCDLSHNVQLVLTVWQVSPGQACKALGGATMSLFSKKGRLKTSFQRLRLWQGEEGSIQCPSTTPGKAPLNMRGEIGRVEALWKRYQRGEIPRVSWLDRLATRHVEGMREQDVHATEEAGELHLVLDMHDFAHAVLYYQTGSGAGTAERVTDSNPSVAAGSLLLINDPELGRENPCELKAQKMARSLTRGVIDRDLKPDTEEKRRISAILNYPPNRPLSTDDKALLWRFRWCLTSDKRALTKFLKCVDWGDANEAKQAAELMQQWVTIDIADALELLSPDFTNKEVRAAAVDVLQRTEDEELLYYLLQLVQALRYESVDDSRLARFIVDRACSNSTMGIFLHWYLYTEWEDTTFGPRAGFVHKMFQDSLPSGSPIMDAISRQMGLVAQLHCMVKELKSSRGSSTRKADRLREMVSEGGPLGELINLAVPLPLDPSVQLLGILPQDCSVFKSALAPLKLTFRTEGPSPHQGPQDPRPSTPMSPTHAPPSPHPATPPTSFTRSHLDPPPFDYSPEGRYMVLYKKGDDLRQDQLVVQMFSLMDRLLKRENLDLKLTPYKVLPTSGDDGMIECVPQCQALAAVLAENRSIHKYLQQYNPDPHGPFGLQSDVLSNFVKSCAGYCVMTYILGVGDRHLDNLMLTRDGRLFHIDFGYILGRDPKPFPPPMKLCKEMVDAMGGPESAYYTQFRTYCCEAYNILRKSANLILSLVHLMAGATIPDIRSDPEKAMLKIPEKLRLDIDDEGAVEWMQQLLNESANALMPQIFETTHKWAQYWR